MKMRVKRNEEEIKHKIGFESVIYVLLFYFLVFDFIIRMVLQTQQAIQPSSRPHGGDVTPCHRRKWRKILRRKEADSVQLRAVVT